MRVYCSRLLLYIIVVFCMIRCDNPEGRPLTMFHEMPSDSTGMGLVNERSFSQQFNIYTYRNLYNGGGVASGDINNDGLIDVYFTRNRVSNRLYLNKGGFRFEDITGKGGFVPLRSAVSGLKVRGQVRDIATLGRQRKLHLVISRNNDFPVVYTAE